jgi:hypothetical protein
MTSQVSVNYVARFRRRGAADLEVPIAVCPQVLTQALLSGRPGKELGIDEDAYVQRRKARIAILGLVWIALRQLEPAPHQPPETIGWDDFQLVRQRQ